MDIVNTTNTSDNKTDYPERIELACHSNFSRMSGISSPKDLVEFAAGHGMAGAALTDLGTAAGFPEFQHQAGIVSRDRFQFKAIYGIDAYVIDDFTDSEIADEASYTEYMLECALPYHMTILVRNQTGLQDLYSLLTTTEKKYKSDQVPVLPLSLLLEKHDGLLISGGRENGILCAAFEAAHQKAPLFTKASLVTFKEVDAIADLIDYIEIPVSADHRMVEALLRLSERKTIPAVAVSAPYYTEKEQVTSRKILLEAGLAYGSQESMEGAAFLTTDEILEVFSWLGEEKALQLVVANTHLIADKCETVRPIPDRKSFPKIDDADEKLRMLCEEKLQQLYGSAEPDEGSNILATARDRLTWELAAIKKSGTAFLFLTLHDLLEKVQAKPWEYLAAGCASASFTAFLCGITEIDPLKDQIPPYFLFGIDGEKEPDIDIRCCTESKLRDRFLEELSDLPWMSESVFAGTIQPCNDYAAEQIVRSYEARHDLLFSDEDRKASVSAIASTLRRHGQHPGGVFLMPKEDAARHLIPLCNSGSIHNPIMVSGMNAYAIDHVLYKLDLLETNLMNPLAALSRITGVDPCSIDTDAPEIMELFLTDETEYPACAGLPEFRSTEVLDALLIAQPKTDAEVVKFICMMHGTDIWEGNAELLLRLNAAQFRDIPGSREDIYDMLKSHGFDDRTAFLIAENVRKGKIASRPDSDKWKAWTAQMREKDIPEWFIWCCEQIRYLFPRTHSLAFFRQIKRLAWYRIHYEEEYRRMCARNE